MRVLLQNSLFYPNVIGGAELSSHLLGQTLRELGHHVDAVATTGRKGSSSRISTRLTADGRGTIFEAPAHGLYDLFGPDGPPPPPGILKRGLHHLAAVHSPRWLGICRKVLDQSRPDIVHTNTLVGMTPAIWQAAEEKGIPVLHTLRDYHLLCPRTTLLRSDGTECSHPPLPCRILATMKLRRTRSVAGVTAPSRWVLNRHLEAGGFRGAEVHVVPNACENIPAVIPDRSGRHRVKGLFLGQLSAHKGVALLLDVLGTLLAESTCPALDFDFAGTGPLVQDILALAAVYPERIRYLGVIAGPAKQKILANADFIAVPSVWNDNFPRTMLDACSWGLPVIGSRRGGIPEVIRDGREGIIIEPCPQELASAMISYVDNPQLRLTHGRAARLHAMDFTLEGQAQIFVDIYASLLGKPEMRAAP